MQIHHVLRALLGFLYASFQVQVYPYKTLNPQPQTLNPKPQTLNPKPYTLNPKP